jgi:UDP-galactopyranose mutase
MAERIATVRGEAVLVLESRDHIGGNLHDYTDENGITVHRYGPHAFHTYNADIWRYLSRFTRWNTYTHRVEAVIDGNSVPLPFNFNTMKMLFPEGYAERLAGELIEVFGFGKKVTLRELRQEERFSFLADYVYEKVYKNYTMKQWGLKPEELDASVADRVPLVTSRDNRYFHDTYQGIPSGGYTGMVEAMLAAPGITVELNSRYAAGDGWKDGCVIHTGMIDEYFGYALGKLPYRSLRFELETLDREYLQATAQKNYPDNYDFTRITEFKHFLDEKSPRTVVAYEYPQAHLHGENEPYYPVPAQDSRALYRQYESLARREKKLAFVGRLAAYRYYNMDQAVEAALLTFEKLNAEGFFGKPA